MKWNVQFSRYALVGLTSNAVGYLLYLLLTYVGMDYKISMTLLYAVGVLQTFYFNRVWSFRYDGRMSTAFMRYVIAYVLGYLLNLGFLWIAVDNLHLPHQIVQAVAIVTVAAFLFVVHKYWVFAPATARRGEA